MKKATKKKMIKKLVWLIPIQAFCVGVYVEIDAFVNQWHHVQHFVSSLFRIIGIAG